MTEVQSRSDARKTAKKAPRASVRSTSKSSPKPSTKPMDTVVGMIPRVDLLPVEVRSRAKVKALRGLLITAVLVAVAVVLAAYAISSLLAVQARSALETEQARTISLLEQQQSFSEVRKVQARVDTSIAAARVGMATEIDWKSLVDQMAASLPAGVTITAVAATSATPTTAYDQGLGPLDTARIAGVQITVLSPGIPEVSNWIDSLESVPGVAEVSVMGVTQLETGYSVDLVAYLDLVVLVNAQAETETEPTE